MKSESPDARVVMTVPEALLWVAEVFNEPPSRVRADTRRPDLLGWDSLGQLVLMSALDEQFGIKLTQDEIRSMISVQDILDALVRHGRVAVP